MFVILFIIKIYDRTIKCDDFKKLSKMKYHKRMISISINKISLFYCLVLYSEHLLYKKER